LAQQTGFGSFSFQKFPKFFSKIMTSRKLPKLTLEQREKLKLAKRYCMDESIRHSMKKEDKQQKAIIQNATAEAIQKQQVSLLMTQCFIGGLDYNVGMREVREAFA